MTKKMAAAQCNVYLRRCYQSPQKRYVPLASQFHRILRTRSLSIRLSSSQCNDGVSSVSTSRRCWVDALPAKMRPYVLLARMDKPIGTLLLFYPCGEHVMKLYLNNLLTIIRAWSITMASYTFSASPIVPTTFLCLFGTGAFIMRGAGCTINDLWDRRLDLAVGWFLSCLHCNSSVTVTCADRTKGRPLARGDILPLQAVAFLGGQLSVGLMVLLQLNWDR